VKKKCVVHVAHRYQAYLAPRSVLHRESCDIQLTGAYPIHCYFSREKPTSGRFPHRQALSTSRDDPITRNSTCHTLNMCASRYVPKRRIWFPWAAQAARMTMQCFVTRSPVPLREQRKQAWFRSQRKQNRQYCEIRLDSNPCNSDGPRKEDTCDRQGARPAWMSMIVMMTNECSRAIQPLQWLKP
jgi:hypothetical protein